MEKLSLISLINMDEYTKKMSEIIDQARSPTKEEEEELSKLEKNIIPGRDKDMTWKTIFNKIGEALRINDTPEEDPAYQDPREVPESAIQSLNKYAMYSEKDPQRRDWFKKRVSNWYDAVYGTDEAKQDAAGRIIEAGQRFTPPLETRPLLSKDGVSIPEGYRQIAQTLAKYPSEPVKKLQKSLNSYEDDFPRLTEDDDLGPQTTSRTKQVLAQYGLKSLQDKLKSIA